MSSLAPPSVAPVVMKPLFVGVDVGGTNIKIGIVDDLGAIVIDGKFATDPAKGASFAFDQAKIAIEKLLDQSGYGWGDVAAVGLGTPGPLDIRAGKILTPTNLPGWHQTKVVEEFSKIVRKPVTLANDAGAAAFGEFWVGSGRQHDSLVLLTLGTGVGGGIIVDGMSIDGYNSHGSELGHITIDTSANARMCGCGQPGHLEAYASATALVARTREALASCQEKGSKSVLHTQKIENSALSALTIAQAASAGDPLAVRMVDETAHYLGAGIAMLAHVIDPTAFLLGGAMNFGGATVPLGRKFIEDIKVATRRLVFPVLAERLIVEFASLGGSAGFVGAAGLARQQFRKSH